MQPPMLTRSEVRQAKHLSVRLAIKALNIIATIGLGFLYCFRTSTTHILGLNKTPPTTFIRRIPSFAKTLT